MTFVRWENGSLLTILSTGLNSLANEGNAVSSEIDNTTDPYLFNDVELYTAPLGYAPAAESMVELYLVETVDGTNYEDGNANIDPPAANLVGIFIIRSTTAAQRHVIRQIPVSPTKYKYVVINKMGNALAASGNTLRCLSYRFQSGTTINNNITTINNINFYNCNCNNNLLLNGELLSDNNQFCEGCAPLNWTGMAEVWPANSVDYGTLDRSGWVDLNTCELGYIQQVFSTKAGQQYTINFKLAGNNNCTPSFPCVGNRQDNTTFIKECKVSVAGISQNYTFDITGTNPTTYDGMGWVNRTLVFTATSSSTTLKFENISPNDCFGAAISCVCVREGNFA